MIPVYQDPHITLYCGNAEDIVPRLAAEGRRFGAIIADPPYCSGGATARERERDTSKYVFSGVALDRPDFEGDQRSQRALGLWAAQWMRQLQAVAARPCYLATFIDRRNLSTLTDAIEVAGWRYTDLLPWDKTEGARPRKGWFRSSQVEYVTVAQLGKRPRDQDYAAGVACLPGFYRHCRRRTDLVEHMHAKPLEVLKWLIAPVAITGGAILDPFAGSASTLIAARELGLEAVGIEQSPEIAARAAARLANEH